MQTPAAPVPPPPPLGLPAAPAAAPASVPPTSVPPTSVPPTGSAAYHKWLRETKKRKGETLQERHDILDTEVANLKMQQILLESENAMMRLRNGTSQTGDAALIERGNIAFGLMKEGKPEVLVLRIMSDVDASKTLTGVSSAQALLTGTLAVHASKRAQTNASKRAKTTKTPTTPESPAVRPLPPPQPAVTAKEATAPPPPPPQPAAHEQQEAQDEQQEAQDGPDFIPEEEYDAWDQEHWEHLGENVTSLSYEPVGTPLITPLPTPFGTPQAPARVRPALTTAPSSPSKMARFLVMG